MKIKDSLKSGLGHSNTLIKIYTIGALGWLGLFILLDLAFVSGAIQDLKHGAISIVDVLFVLLVLTFIAVVPILPLWLYDFSKIGSKKEEKPEEEPEEEKPESE